MGLGGKVASNDDVKNWSGDYRPVSSGSKSSDSTDANGSWIGGSNNYSRDSGSSGSSYSSPSRSYYRTYQSIDINGLYDAIEQAKLKALQAAKEENAKKLAQSIADIEGNYEDSVRNTHVQSRLSALGNEEKLAAMGLNSASAYDMPTSGYTETSRISRDNMLSGNLNSLMTARNTAKSAATNTVNDANSRLDSEAAEYSANLKLSRIRDLIDQYNNEREYQLKSDELSFEKWAKDSSLSLDRDKLNADTEKINAEIAAQKQKQQAAYALEQQKTQNQLTQTAYENALERWKIYGTVLPSDEKILGVPKGTSTSAKAYQDAKYELERLKTLHQVSK